MKKYLIILGIVVILVGIIYTGLYTYFTETKVSESLPPSVSGGQKMLVVGTFGEIDFIHKGSGQAKLIESDGKKFLRFEDFKVTSGPDLYVYLTKSEKPTGDAESLGDFIDLGLLKGTMGNQNYEITQDISGYKTAVIWCKRFGILFSYAVMR